LQGLFCQMAKRKAILDVDPEDEFFGQEDGTRANFSKKKRNQELDKSYLKDVETLKTRLDEESLCQGVKTSRKELGLIPSDESELDDSVPKDDLLEYVDPDDVSENEFDNSSLSSTQEDPVLFRKESSIPDYERGCQVRNQLDALTFIINFRISLQPLLLKIEKVGSMTKSSRQNLLEELKQLEANLTSFLQTDLGKTDLITENILQATEQVYSDSHIVPLNTFKTIYKSGWQKVCDIFDEKNSSALTKFRSRCFNDGLYHDGDFYQCLLRDYTSKLSLDGKAGGIIVTALKKEKKKRDVDPKASKGRRLNFEVHEKLANYMTPYRPGNCWNDSKIDDFFNSIIGGH
jgi:hypothetical protein